MRVCLHAQQCMWQRGGQLSYMNCLGQRHAITAAAACLAVLPARNACPQALRSSNSEQHKAHSLRALVHTGQYNTMVLCVALVPQCAPKGQHAFASRPIVSPQRCKVREKWFAYGLQPSFAWRVCWHDLLVPACVLWAPHLLLIGTIKQAGRAVARSARVPCCVVSCVCLSNHMRCCAAVGGNATCCRGFWRPSIALLPCFSTFN
jgi:hypothetical protein